MSLIFFSCLLVLDRTFRTMLCRSGKSGHPFQVCELRRIAFSSSTLSVMLTVGSLYKVYIVLRFPSTYNVFRDFIMKECWILSKTFCIYWKDQMILCYFNMLQIYISNLKEYSSLLLKNFRFGCLIILVIYGFSWATMGLPILDFFLIKKQSWKILYGGILIFSSNGWSLIIGKLIFFYFIKSLMKDSSEVNEMFMCQHTKKFYCEWKYHIQKSQ